MSRRQPKLFAIAVVLSLLLAALPAAAVQGRAGARARAPQATDWMKVTWGFLTSLWTGAPAPQGVVSIRGSEGGSLDPHGTSGATTTSTPQLPPPSDEGASLDPHG
jgi:hypothetical protein